MKKIIVTLLIFISISYCKNENNSLFYGVVKNGEILSRFSFAKISLTSWIEETSANYENQVKMKYFDTSKELFDNFKDQEINIAAINLLFYFQNEKEIKQYTDYIWTISMFNKTYHQYYLISADSNGFKDLKNKTLTIKRTDNIAKSWLDKNSYLSNKKSSDKLLENIFYEKRQHSIILKVFFGKSDYGIVTREVWDIATAFNPAIKKKLKIVSKSEKIFLPLIGFVTKNNTEKNVKIFHKLTNSLRKLQGSNNSDPSVRIDNIIKLDDKKLEKLRNYYEEYFVLKEKYN